MKIFENVNDVCIIHINLAFILMIKDKLISSLHSFIYHAYHIIPITRERFYHCQRTICSIKTGEELTLTRIPFKNGKNLLLKYAEL